MNKKKRYYGLALSVFAVGVGIIYFFMRPAPFISLFPIEHYDQVISHWIKPTVPDYAKPLLSAEKQTIRFTDFKRHYYGDLSPWDLKYIKKNVTPSGTKASVIDNLEHYSNLNKPPKKMGYGLNLRPLTTEWIQRLKTNCNLSQFSNLTINAQNRAITVNNTHGRELPTEDVHMYHPRYAGQGYPFDNLQASAVWAGTPLYVVAQSADRAWVLVQTPNFMAWVKSTDIAWVDEAFVATWAKAANQQLLAITDTQIALIDEDNQVFRGTGYIGMAFPGENQGKTARIMFPVRDEGGRAQIHYVRLQQQQAVTMPFTATPAHMLGVIDKLIARPYGWGSMYFYNDCSSELKNLFTPFGLWIPINSSAQVDPQGHPVRLIDLSKEEREARLAFLMSQGHPFMTIINDGGHVLLYLGNYPNPNDPKQGLVALSYQNVWGLDPRAPKAGEDRRSIIGGSVLLPILPYYPEDRGVASDVDYQTFKLGFLDG